MSDLRSLRFNTLKKIGQIQTNFMWDVNIPYIPFSDNFDNVLFNISARSTNIPKISRKFNVLRFNDGEYTLPAGRILAHEFNINMICHENFKLHEKIENWYNQIDLVDGIITDVMKTEIILNLLSIDGQTANKTIILLGAYPLSIPPLEGLDKDSIDGIIKFDVEFAFDEIKYKPSLKGI